MNQWVVRLFFILNLTLMPAFAQAVAEPIEPLTASEIRALGELKTSFKELVDQKQNLFVQCYRSALKRRPSLKGRVTWEWTLDPKGRIRAVKMTENQIADSRFYSCAMDHARSIQWIKRSEVGGAGVEAHISYSMVFRP